MFNRRISASQPLEQGNVKSSGVSTLTRSRKGVRRQPAHRMSTQLMLETLEDRRVLAVLVQPFPSGPNVVPGVDASVQQGAIASFHGPDGVGKDGPMAKVGPELTVLYHDYLRHRQTTPNTPYTAENDIIQIRNDRVAVDAVATGDPAALSAALQRAGMSVDASAAKIVSGWIPLSKLGELASVTGLSFARPSYKPVTDAGLVISQGDVSLKSSLAREKFTVDGTGVKIGVVSDSYNNLGTAAVDINSCVLLADGGRSCDLPGRIEVVADMPLGGTDEGRAMLQIVHDVAPGASLAFATSGESEAEMAANIRRLADAGSDVIVDDVNWFAAPFFQDGVIARAINDVAADGVAYFTSAGNVGENGYESAFRSSGVTGPTNGQFHDFNIGGAVDPYQEVTIPVGGVGLFVLQWDQPFGSLGANGAQSDVDAYLFGADRQSLLAASVTNNIGGDAVEVLFFNNLSATDQTFNLAIELSSGVAPGRLKVLYFQQAAPVEYGNRPSVAWGHKTVAGGAAVAAAAYYLTPNSGVDPPIVNDFSSRHGTPILFDGDGNRLATPEVRIKPDVTGPDGVDTTFFGQAIVVDNNPWPNFFGTSAAAPHVAAVAALMIEAAGNGNELTPTQIYETLRATAIDIKSRMDPFTLPVNFSLADEPIIDGEGYDVYSGYGLVNAYDAIQAVQGLPVGTGSISGIKWNDLNGDGIRTTNEPGLSGWTIYVDTNRNGQLDVAERSSVTDATGAYSITGLPLGSHRIAEVSQTAWQRTFPSAGSHTVNLSAGQSVTGINFGSQRIVSSVSGIIWDDVDGDGIHDLGEPGLAGSTVYVDVDRDGLVSVLDPRIVTDATGFYRIDGVGSGDVRIQAAPRSGWTATTPTVLNVDVVPGANVLNINFGFKPVFVDPNDPTPDPNPGPSGGTTSNATHGYTPGFYLGTGFNTSGGVAGRADGVVFLTGIQPGRSEQLVVIAQQISVSRGFLHGWIDFNGDGIFAVSERIIDGKRLNNGTNVVDFQVPAGVAGTNLNARFRWAFERQLGPTGPSLGGEVEDYIVSVPMDPMVGLVAADDTATVAEDSGNTSIAVLANDILGPLGGTLALSSVGTPSRGGQATVSGNQVVYRPAPNFFGIEVIAYTITDGLGNFSNGNILVTVAEANDPPIANDDTFSSVFSESVNVVLDVLANDSALPDTGETLTLSVNSSTSAGGLVIPSPDGRTLLYTPRPGFVGTERFDYRVSDGRGGSDAATVTVQVAQAAPQIEYQLQVTDSDGNVLPNVNVNDTFFLSVYVTDLRTPPLGIQSAFLDVRFNNTNLLQSTGPILFNSAVFGSAQNGTVQTGLIDEAGAVSSITQGGTGQPTDRVLLWRAPYRALGTGTVTFSADPADILPAHETTLVGINFAIGSGLQVFENTSLIIAGAVADQVTVLEDSEATLIDVLANDVAAGSGALTIASLPVSPANGTATIVDGNRIRYTPNANFFGVDTFTYTAQGSNGLLSTATVTVTVQSVNDPPTAVDDVFSREPGLQSVSLDLLRNDITAPDPATETLRITAVSPTTNGGSVVIGGGGLTAIYTPPFVGFEGTDTFTYTVTDENGGTDTATVTVNFLAEAEFRLVATDQQGNDISQLRIGETFYLQVLVQDVRPVPTGLFSAYLDVAYPGDLIVVDGPIEFDTVNYTNGQRGNTTVSGTLNDMGALAPNNLQPLGGGEFFLFRVPMRAVNDGVATMQGFPTGNAPLLEVTFFGDQEEAVANELIRFGSDSITIRREGAVNDIFTVVEDSPTSALAVLANDVPPPGLGPLMLVSATQPANGQVLLAGQTLNYMPNPNFQGTDTFTYTVEDTSQGRTTATVTVNVSNVNDNPTAVNDQFTVAVGSSNNSLTVLANDSSLPDPPETLIITAVGGANQGGTVAVAANGGSLIYTPAIGFTGQETVTYTISDGNGGTAQAQATIQVRVPPPAPVVRYDLRFTDTNGNPIDTVQVGNDFMLSVFVQDLRAQARGVFSAYLDVSYAGTGSGTINGPLAFNNTVYPSAHSGATGTAGLIDELGAVDGTTRTDTGEPVLLVRVPFTAVSPGTFVATGDHADLIPPHETVLFGTTSIVANELMEFTTDSLTIIAGVPAAAAFRNANNPFDVDMNNEVTPLDALLVINELDRTGGGALQQSGLSIARSLESSMVPRFLVDVNGDNRLSPMDALWVINELDNEERAAERSQLRAPLSASVGLAAVVTDPLLIDRDRAAAAVPATATAAVDEVLSEVAAKTSSKSVEQAERRQSPLAAVPSRLRSTDTSWRGTSHVDRSNSTGTLEELALDVAFADIQGEW